MPNHASSVKRVRSDETKRLRNRYQHKTCRTAIKKLEKTKQAQEGTQQLAKVTSMIDKLAKRGIFHKNKSANLKSRLAKLVGGMQ